MVFTFLCLESYLGLSEETRSPNAGSEDGRGQKPQPGFPPHRGAHLPKGSGAWPPPESCPPVPPPGPQPGPGPGPLQGGGLERDASSRAQLRGCFGGGGVGGWSHSLPAPTITATLAPGRPGAYTPGGRKFFFPPFFPPGAAQAQGLLQPCESRRGRLQPPPPPPREPSPAFRVLRPCSQARPGPTQPPAPWVPGAASLAP